MPKRKYGGSSNQRGRKRTRRSKRVMRVSRGVVAPSTITKMKYVTQFQLNPTTGAVATKDIYANVANNPEAASGHQPMGWDQWGQFYDKYVVLGAKCSVMAHTTTSTSSGQNIIGIRLKDDPYDVTTVTTVSDILEQGGISYRPLTNLTSRGVATVSKNYSARRHHGKDLSQIQGKVDDTVLTAPLLGGSDSEVYFEVMLLPTDATQDPAAVFCTATISYIVKFMEPKTLASS